MFVLPESHLDFQNQPSDLKTEVEHNLSKGFFIALKAGSEKLTRNKNEDRRSFALLDIFQNVDCFDRTFAF